MADGILQYDILADGAQFERTVSACISKVASLGAKMTGLAAVGGALGGLAFTISAITKAADFEQIQVQFRNLVGDIRAADAALAELRKQADATPYEFTELAKAATGLIAAKVGLSELGATIEALGNLAAGTSQPLERMVAPFQQILTLGKVTYEDIKQFAEAGVPIFEALGAAMGKSSKEAAQAVSDGAVSVEIFKRAILGLGGAGGQWGQMMAQQAKTTKGLLSSLKDAVDAIMLAFGKPINDAIKPVLQGAIGLATELAPIFAGLGQQVANVVTALHNVIARAKEGGGVIAALIGSVGDLVKTIIGYAKDFGSVLMVAVVGFADALVTTVTPVFQWMGAEFSVMANRFGSQLLYAMAMALGKVPGMSGAAESLLEQADALDAAAARAQMASAKAVRAIPAAAAKGMSEVALTVQQIMEALEAKIKKAQQAAKAVTDATLSDQAAAPDNGITRGATLALPPVQAPSPSSGESSDGGANSDAQRKARQNAMERGFALQDLAILEAKAGGHDKLAKKLEAELRLQQLINEYKTRLNATDEQALELAERRLKAEQTLADQQDGKAKRIRGYRQADGPARTFGGLDEMEAKKKKGGVLDGMRTPGLDAFYNLQRRTGPAFPQPGQNTAGSDVMKKLTAANSNAKAAQDRAQQAAKGNTDAKLQTMIVELQSVNRTLAGLAVA